VALLRPVGVRRLVDVRTLPRSRRHPHFAAEALAQSLPPQGIAYRHEPGLGGFRRPRPDSPNRGWEHQGFRGYADYMATPGFAEALSRLEEAAKREPSCVMCAEAQWWRCHRRLVSDALTVRGWRVRHLGLRTEPVDHQLTPFLVVEADGSLKYPAAQTELEI